MLAIISDTEELALGRRFVWYQCFDFDLYIVLFCAGELEGFSGRGGRGAGFIGGQQFGRFVRFFGGRNGGRGLVGNKVFVVDRKLFGFFDRQWGCLGGLCISGNWDIGIFYDGEVMRLRCSVEKCFCFRYFYGNV